MTTPTNEPEETATPFCDKAAFDVGACQCDDEPYMVVCLLDAKELEKRAIRAERERDDLRVMLEELLTANASPSITGFAQACEKAISILTRTKPAQ